MDEIHIEIIKLLRLWERSLFKILEYRPRLKES